MPIPNSFKQILVETGFFLSDFGINETGLERADALRAIAALKESDVAVLGGDVYRMKDSNLVPTLDNWYCQKQELEAQPDYLTRSWQLAEDWISNYRESDDEVFIYTLVLSSKY